MYYRPKRGYEKTRFVGLNIDSRFAGAEWGGRNVVDD